MSETTPDLRDALQKLVNEVTGALAIGREDVREAIGTTNLRCLENRLREAAAALAVPRQPSDEKDHDLCLPVGHGLKGENVHSEPETTIPVEAPAEDPWWCNTCGSWTHAQPCGRDECPPSTSGGWHPMATAPQEGTMTLFCSMAATEARTWCFVDWIAGGSLVLHPTWSVTHWMPLPSPPLPHGQDASPQRTEGTNG
jgi:hypothetical protein